MAAGSSEQDLSAFYRRYIACCNSHEFYCLGAFVASGVQVNGDVQSLPEYIRNLEVVVEAFPDYHWDLQHLLVDGEWVAAHLIDTGTHLAPSWACNRPARGDYAGARVLPSRRRPYRRGMGYRG